MTRRQRSGALASVIAGLVACTGQEGPDYGGRPLAVIHGTVRSAVPVSGPLEVTVWWSPGLGPVDRPDGAHIPQHVEVSSELPSDFTLALFEPPPADSYRSPADPERGWPASSRAKIMAGRPGRSIEDPVVAGDVVGFTRHQIWYLHGDIVEGTAAAESIGRPLSAGHHVTTYCDDPMATGGELLPCYRLAPDDLDTVIVLELSVL